MYKEINYLTTKGYGWIELHKARRSSIPLEVFLKDIDLNEYWILKSTNSFKFLEIDELKKYSGFILFDKTIYKKEDIEQWFEYLKVNKINFNFLGKPFPSFEITKLISVYE